MTLLENAALALTGISCLINCIQIIRLSKRMDAVEEARR